MIVTRVVVEVPFKLEKLGLTSKPKNHKALFSGLFRKAINKQRDLLEALEWPLTARAELHIPPGTCDWDLSNLWAYYVLFENMMKKLKIIPDDCILYITKPASFHFIPITPQEQPKMIFFFTRDSDERVITHSMFHREPKKARLILKSASMPTSEKYIQLLLSTSGDTGSVLIDVNKNSITINVGKREILAGRATNALTTVYWEAINQNKWVLMKAEDYRKIESYIKRNLLDKGIEVFIDNTLTNE